MPIEMKRTMTRTLLCTLLLLPSLALAAPDYKVAGIFDLTSGAGAAWGSSERDGFLFAAREFESLNPGIKVRYAIEDSAYQTSRAVSAFHKLTSIDNFRYIVGPTWEPFVAVQPLCERQKVLCLSISSNNGYFDDAKGHYSVTTWVDERDYTRVIAERIKLRNYSKVAVITSVTSYHDLITETLVKNLTIKPLLIERVDSDMTDFRSLIARFPMDLEALVVLLAGEDALPIFAQQWAQVRKDRPEILTDDYVLYAPRRDLPKTLGFKLWSSGPDFESPEFEVFKRKYSKVYGKEPSAPGAAVAYDSTLLLLGCMKTTPGQDPLAVEGCVKNSASYLGASGEIRFEGGRFAKRTQMRLREL